MPWVQLIFPCLLITSETNVFNALRGLSGRQLGRYQSDACTCRKDKRRGIWRIYLFATDTNISELNYPTQALFYLWRESCCDSDLGSSFERYVRPSEAPRLVVISNVQVIVPKQSQWMCGVWKSPEVRVHIGFKMENKHKLKHRFDIIRKLGQGTYGKVQLAINKETGQEVSYWRNLQFWRANRCFFSCEFTKIEKTPWNNRQLFNSFVV